MLKEIEKRSYSGLVVLVIMLAVLGVAIWGLI